MKADLSGRHLILTHSAFALVTIGESDVDGAPADGSGRPCPLIPDAMSPAAL